MSDWLEVKQIENGSAINKVSTRVYNVTGVKSTGLDSCRIYITEDYGEWINAAEPYDSIMARICELEERPAPIIERFSEEEYRLLLTVVEDAQTQYGEKTRPADVLKSIEKTIKTILEEEY